MSGARASAVRTFAPTSDPGPVRGRVSLATKIETDRLTLRALRATDVRALRAFEIENQAHLRAWSPRPRQGVSPTSLIEIARRVAIGRKDWRADRGYGFGVFCRDEGGKSAAYVGRVAFSGLVRGAFQNAYLGYLVGAAHQGRGFAREAVRGACDFAFDTLRLHRLQAAIMPNNERSLRLVEALGFRKEGRAQGYLMIDGDWRDHMIFAITLEEWRARGTT